MLYVLDASDYENVEEYCYDNCMIMIVYFVDFSLFNMNNKYYSSLSCIAQGTVMSFVIFYYHLCCN